MYETIDCVGNPSFEAHLLYGFFRKRIRDEGNILRVSKVHNRRSFFSRWLRPTLGTLGQHPRVLLEHARILEILYSSDMEKLKTIANRFNSTPLHVASSPIPMRVRFPLGSLECYFCRPHRLPMLSFCAQELFGGFRCIAEVYLRSCQTRYPLMVPEACCQSCFL